VFDAPGGDETAPTRVGRARRQIDATALDARRHRCFSTVSAGFRRTCGVKTTGEILLGNPIP